jgi:hypothetical protein
MARLDRVEISLSKVGCLKQLLLLVTVAGFALFMRSDALANHCSQDDFAFWKVMLPLMACYAAYFSCLRVKQLCSRAPGLVLDEHGLMDHSSSFSPRFVAWKAIAETKIVRQRRSGLVLFIRLCDVPAQDSAERGTVIHVAREPWHKVFSGSVRIPDGLLKIDLDDLLQLVQRYQSVYTADGGVSDVVA